jgi:hypothetical protein
VIVVSIQLKTNLLISGFVSAAGGAQLGAVMGTFCSANRLAAGGR